MRIKNLIEAQLKPGQRKGMSLKISKLEKMLKKINDYQESASGMHGIKVPDSVAAEYEKVKQGIYDEIEKLNSEKDQFKSEKNNMPVKFYNLMQGIAKNCTEIVKAYTDLNPDFKTNKAKVFYRGIKSSEDALYGKPFDERRVMTSSSQLSDILNGAMEAAGFEARRDNSSFVSSDKSQASGYGKLYVMFPKDGFSFTWSRNTKDLILDRGSYSKMVDYEKLAPLKDAIISNKDQLTDYKYGFSFDSLFSDYDLDNTLRSAKLAIEDGKIPAELEPLTDLKNVMPPEAIVKGFDLDNQDLTGAIESEKEVYIRGAYYAVQESLMKDIMKFLELQVYPEGKPKKIVPGQYEIGDRVTVKSKGNNYYGKSGEVQYVYANYGDVSVQLDGENWTNDFKFKDIKHEGTEDDREYAENEQVEVIDKNSEYFGKKGTISFIFGSGKLELFLQGGTYGTVMPDQVKLVDSKTDSEEKVEEPKIDDDKIKIGDQVKIIGKHPNAGEVATVLDVFEYFKDTTLALDNGKELHDVPLASLEKVSSAPKSLEIGDVKVQDTVKIIGDHPDSGKTGTVAYAYSTKPDIDVEFSDGNLAYNVKLKNVEKAQPAAEPDVDVNDPDFDKINLDWEPEPEVVKPASEKLVAGDKVKITSDHYGGHTGVIEEILNTGMVKVKLDTTGTSAVFYKTELSKIEGKPAESEKINFEAGMPVKIGGTGPHAGKTGTVNYVSSVFKEADILLPDGKMIPDIPLEDLEQVSNEPKAVAEPKAEQPNFKSGDGVKIINGTNNGKVGFIDYLSNVLQTADIKTPHGGIIHNIPLTDLKLMNMSPGNKSPEGSKVPLKDLPAVKELIKNSAQSNQVTIDQLDQAMGTSKPTGAEIEELMDYLINIGMEIVDSGEF